MSRLILVLGMHRSGTSLIAKSLECLGINLGYHLLGPAVDNPLGFFEDRQFIEVNNTILRECGLRWYTPEEPSRPFMAVSKTIREYAKKLLASRVKEFPIFGLKDPRFCRTLPFWKPIFQELGLDVGCVLTVRNPKAIFASLAKRNGMPFPQAEALTRIYVKSAIEHAIEWPGVNIAYEEMLRAPEQQVHFMAEALGLGIDHAKLSQFCEEFIRPELDHSRSTPQPKIGVFQWPR